MKIFVFGAGASRGAQNQQTYTDGHPEAAPLVEDLFHDKYAQIASEASINLDELRSASQKAGSVEQYLTQRWNQISARPPLQQQTEKVQFGRLTYYCWRILSVVSSSFPNSQGYSPLLRKLHNRDDNYALISFNYDTLLDQSVADVVGLPLTQMADYHAARLYKPHGSVNWHLPARSNEDHPLGFLHPKVLSRQTTARMFVGTPLTARKTIIVDPSLHITQYEDAVSLHGSRHFYPLLFIPMAGKLYESVQDFFDQMILPTEEHFRKASEIFLIGYRAEDRLIHELLRQAPKGTPLHVIGRDSNSASSISSMVLGKNLNLSQGNVHAEGFESFVNSY